MWDWCPRSLLMLLRPLCSHSTSTRGASRLPCVLPTSGNPSRPPIVIKFLMKAGPYKVQIKVLNSLEFGVPQSRKRVYIVGIREDCAVQDFTWPVPFGTPPITKFLDKGVTPKHMSDAKLKNVKACFTAIKKKTGMDPT